MTPDECKHVLLVWWDRSDDEDQPQIMICSTCAQAMRFMKVFQDKP